MNTHSWAFHPLCTHDFDNESLTVKRNAQLMTSDSYRSIPMLAKTRNLSSHTTCSPTPALCRTLPCMTYTLVTSLRTVPLLFLYLCIHWLWSVISEARQTFIQCTWQQTSFIYATVTLPAASCSRWIACIVECNTILDSTSLNWGPVGRGEFSTGEAQSPMAPLWSIVLNWAARFFKGWVVIYRGLLLFTLAEVNALLAAAAEAYSPMLQSHRECRRS